MVKIDTAHNRIETKRVAGLCFRKHEHLQKWRMHCPLALIGKINVEV